VFKLPNPPSPKATINELADFAEILCLKNRRISAREIVAYLGRLDDNENNIGCDDDDDDNAALVDEMMNEVERRLTACDGHYPFCLNRKGTVLRFSDEVWSFTDPGPIVYLYLLMCTRLKMTTNGVHADLDGTHILEHLSAHVLRNYLGWNRSKSFVFGTANQRSFHEKVNDLCERLGEGMGFRSLKCMRRTDLMDEGVSLHACSPSPLIRCAHE
jgi:hypothetical protein